MKTGIIGAGKIGSAVGSLAEHFSEVVYVDKDPKFSSDYKLLSDADITFISVNTTTDECYDMGNIRDCLSEVKLHGIKNVVILSTCPASFFDSEFDYDVIYSPLFIRQGTIQQDIIDAEFVLIGSTGGCEHLVEFYNKIGSYNFVKVTQKEAAVIKMGINGFLTIKVAYANMIGDFCESHGMNTDAVLAAIASCKSVNGHYFKYGFGYGGPCLPIDNRTLASETGSSLPYAVDAENEDHLSFMVNDVVSKNKLGSRIVIDGVSYKKGVPIITNSQKMEMAMRLSDDFDVVIRDSKDVCELVERKYPGVFSFEEV